ncbi:MAG: DNA recombination protein RmuC [Gemmatimonadota bacterium]
MALRRQRRATAELAAGLASRVEAGGTQLQSRLDGLTTLLNQRLDAVSGSMDERLRSATESLDRRLAENTERVDARLGQSVHVAQQSTADVGQRLESVSRVVADVQESLGRMGEASRRILEVGQDLRSLQDILRAPKLRGGLGELFLADVLGQILPRQHFTLQHRFRSGETVDAVVRLGGGLVPIDSKFPLEGFRRLTQLTEEAERRRERRLFVSTVKRHADSIAKKYILPDEGTFDFALMYIPAENVYYEAILRDDDATEDDGLLAHALARRVIPVSPCSFYAYLQAIVLGLKGLQVEQRAREIADHLDRLQGDFGKFGECFDLVGKHLKNAQNTFEKADGMRKKLEAKLEGSARLAPPDEAPLEPDPGAFQLFDAVEGARSG